MGILAARPWWSVHESKASFLDFLELPFPWRFAGLEVWRRGVDANNKGCNDHDFSKQLSLCVFVCVCVCVFVCLSLLRLQPSSLQAINIVPFSRASSRVPLLCRHRTLSGPCTRTLPIERMIALILRTAINWRRQISRISLDPGCFEIRPAFEAQISHAERFG